VIEQDVIDMVSALNYAGSPHTFRYGKTVATVSGFYSYDRTLVVQEASATYDGVPVFLDCPLHWTGFFHDGDPLATVYKLIANLVKDSSGA